MSIQCWKRNHTLDFVQTVDLLFCVLLYYLGKLQQSTLINLSDINPKKKWIYFANTSYKHAIFAFLMPI